MEWFYAQGENRIGPVSREELAGLITQGVLGPDTLVWRDGMANWAPLNSVAELAAPSVPAVAVTAAATPMSAPISAAGNTVTCAVSGKQVPRDEAVQIGNDFVSAEHKATYVQRIREGTAQSATFQYAGFWIRVLAKILDTVIIQSAFFAIFFVLGSIGTVLNPESQSVGFLVLTNLISMVLYYGYNVFFLGKFGATPGKMALKLKVVRADGTPITYLRGFGRCLAEILSGMILGIGYIMAAFDDEKKALHDRICDTRVIRQ